jgi:hypothetical protein
VWHRRQDLGLANEAEAMNLISRFMEKKLLLLFRIFRLGEEFRRLSNLDDYNDNNDNDDDYNDYNDNNDSKDVGRMDCEQSRSQGEQGSLDIF